MIETVIVRTMAEDVLRRLGARRANPGSPPVFAIASNQAGPGSRLSTALSVDAT